MQYRFAVTFGTLSSINQRPSGINWSILNICAAGQVKAWNWEQLLKEVASDIDDYYDDYDY